MLSKLNILFSIESNGGPLIITILAFLHAILKIDAKPNANIIENIMLPFFVFNKFIIDMFIFIKSKSKSNISKDYFIFYLFIYLFIYLFYLIYLIYLIYLFDINRVVPFNDSTKFAVPFALLICNEFTGLLNIIDNGVVVNPNVPPDEKSVLGFHPEFVR